MQQKEKLEKVLNVDIGKIFLNYHTYSCIFFLNDSLFPRLQEYNQFHIYNVPSTKNFICGFLCPCKINKILRFYCWHGFAAGMDNVPDV